LGTRCLYIANLAHRRAYQKCAFGLWQARKQEIRKSVRWYSTAATAGLPIAALYLSWRDMIGPRT